VARASVPAGTPGGQGRPPCQDMAASMRRTGVSPASARWMQGGKAKRLPPLESPVARASCPCRDGLEARPTAYLNIWDMEDNGSFPGEGQ
jgi:hypothetical protein